LVKASGFPLPPGADAPIAAEPPQKDEVTPPALHNPSTTPDGLSNPERRSVTIDRIIRDTLITAEVKRLHNHECQVCGTRLETPEGWYAECAHIRPLGAPHDGPDRVDNVRCLCPNCHVLFDKGAFSITDDLRLLGMEGTLRTVQGHSISKDFLDHHRKRIFQTCSTLSPNS
jgi:putative restriction endonuclease